MNVSLITLAGLEVDWEIAAMDAIADVESETFRAALSYRQESRDADVVLVAYPAVRHGSPDVEDLINKAYSASAPPWRRLCIAACDRSEELVTPDDVAGLVAGSMLCSTGRFVHVGELREKFSEWLRVTGLQVNLDSKQAVEDGEESDTAPIIQKGEPWNADWL